MEQALTFLIAGSYSACPMQGRLFVGPTNAETISSISSWTDCAGQCLAKSSCAFWHWGNSQHTAPNTCVLMEGKSGTKDDFHSFAGARDCQGKYIYAYCCTAILYVTKSRHSEKLREKNAIVWTFLASMVRTWGWLGDLPRFQSSWCSYPSLQEGSGKHKLKLLLNIQIKNLLIFIYNKHFS